MSINGNLGFSFEYDSYFQLGDNSRDYQSENIAVNSSDSQSENLNENSDEGSEDLGMDWSDFIIWEDHCFQEPHPEHTLWNPRKRRCEKEDLNIAQLKKNKLMDAFNNKNIVPAACSNLPQELPSFNEFLSSGKKANTSQSQKSQSLPIIQDEYKTWSSIRLNPQDVKLLAKPEWNTIYPEYKKIRDLWKINIPNHISIDNRKVENGIMNVLRQHSSCPDESEIHIYNQGLNNKSEKQISEF